MTVFRGGTPVVVLLHDGADEVGVGLVPLHLALGLEEGLPEQGLRGFGVWGLGFGVWGLGFRV